MVVFKVVVQMIEITFTPDRINRTYCYTRQYDPDNVLFRKTGLLVRGREDFAWQFFPYHRIILVNLPNDVAGYVI